MLDPQASTSLQEIEKAYDILSSCWVVYHSEVHATPMRDHAPVLLQEFKNFFEKDNFERNAFYKEKFDLAFGKDRQALKKLKTLHDEIDFDKIGVVAASSNMLKKYQDYQILLQLSAEESKHVFFPFLTSPQAFKAEKLGTIYASSDPLWRLDDLDGLVAGDRLIRISPSLLVGLWSEDHFQARLLFGYCKVLIDVFSIEIASNIYLSSATELLTSTSDPFHDRNEIVLQGVTLAKRLFAVELIDIGIAVTDRVKSYSSLYCKEYPYIVDQVKKLGNFVDGAARPTIRPSHPFQIENINRLKIGRQGRT
jgi:hypothetical protein